MAQLIAREDPECMLMQQETGGSIASIVDVASYWDRRPCNIRHSTREIGTREYFDEVEARKYFVEPHIPGFAQFERWRDKRVLEIGCGIGTDAVNFVRAGADYTGVELSEVSLDLARRRFEIFGLHGELHPWQRGGTRRLGRARVVRPRLLLRRHPPHAEPAGSDRGGAAGHP